MNFESYAERIATLREPDDERNKKLSKNGCKLPILN